MEGVAVFEVDGDWQTLEGFLCGGEEVPLRIAPTSSIVRSFPAAAGELDVPIPPRYPQRRIEKITFWTSRVQRPLYLPGQQSLNRIWTLGHTCSMGMSRQQQLAFECYQSLP